MVTTADLTQVRPAASDAEHRPGPARAMSVLVSLPDRLIIGFLGVSLVVALSLLAEQFRPWLVLPLSAVVLIGCLAFGRRVTPQPIRVGWASAVGVGSAFIGAAVWCVAQWRHTAEMIGLDRDPAQYTLSALWLISHPSPDIAVNTKLPELAALVPGVQTDFLNGNFGAVNHVQGNDLLPGLLGVAGWLRGAAGVFHANVLIGGVALVAVYAFARRVLGPLWGLLPLIVLGVTMPLAAFSRVPYTEPTALVFVGGMLATLWAAIHERRPWLFALSGAFAGGTMIARIDGGLTVVAALAALSLLAVAASSPQRRQEGRRGLLLFAAGAAPLVAMAWLDLHEHSPQYLHSLAKQTYPLIAVMPVVAVAGWALSRWRRFAGGFSAWLVRHRKGLLVGSAVVVGLAAVAMVTRPFWMVGHHQYNHDGLDYVGSVAARQKAEGLPVDGTRSYDEMTVNWLAWYLSWPVVALGLLGAWWAAVTFVRRRDPRLLTVWAIVVVVSGFYLNNISITADQIWAARRLMPLIIPATAVGAAFAMRAVVSRLPRVRWVGAVAAVVVVALPAIFWGQLFDSREGAGEYDFLNQICQLAGSNTLIVQAGAYPITGSMLPALQELCTDSAIQVNSPTVSTLAAIRANWTGRIVVVAFFPDSVVWTTPVNGAKPLAKVVFNRWESVIAHRPQQLQLQQASAWLGTLETTGFVKPLGATPFGVITGG